MVVKNGAILSCQSLRIEVNSAVVDIEKGGLVDGTGYGYLKETGPGRGYRAAYDASGGGHASLGEAFYFLGYLLEILSSGWTKHR